MISIAGKKDALLAYEAVLQLLDRLCLPDRGLDFLFFSSWAFGGTASQQIFTSVVTKLFTGCAR
jgi:hypothetical protein